MSDKPMMTCGHAANATTADERPACAICGCTTVDESAPSLEGRTAHCQYGRHAEKPSSPALAFFAHHPEQEHDRYYCGCYGWD